MKYNPDIIKTDRKTVSLEVRPDGKVTVRAPKRMTYREIEKFIEEKSPWIEKTIAKYSRISSEEIVPYSVAEIDAMTELAKKIIPPRVNHWAAKVGVTYERITIRHPKTRWGSCSSKGSLSFNCLLTQMPEDVMDSVIVHELCHRKEMNHSKKFYDEILRVMPDYFEKDKWLKQNGIFYMRKIPKN